jgi:mRNA interferase RelE/StbE
MNRNRYWVEIPDYVQRAIAQLPGHIRPRVKRMIAALADEPRPANAEELQNALAGMYRIKIENYRIIYEVFDDIVVIEILRVARRGPNTYIGLR